MTVGLTEGVSNGGPQDLIQLLLLHLRRGQVLGQQQVLGGGPLCRVMVQQPSNDMCLQKTKHVNEDRLYVPVISDCHSLSFIEISPGLSADTGQNPRGS